MEDGGREWEGCGEDEGEGWYLLVLLASGTSICMWYDIPFLPVFPAQQSTFHPLLSVYPPHQAPAQTFLCPSTASPC